MTTSEHENILSIARQQPAPPLTAVPEYVHLGLTGDTQARRHASNATRASCAAVSSIFTVALRLVCIYLVCMQAAHVACCPTLLLLARCSDSKSSDGYAHWHTCLLRHLPKGRAAQQVGFHVNGCYRMAPPRLCLPPSCSSHIPGPEDKGCKHGRMLQPCL